MVRSPCSAYLHFAHIVEIEPRLCMHISIASQVRGLGEVQSSLETEVCGVILTKYCLSIVWRCVQAEVVMLTKGCLSIVRF